MKKLLLSLGVGILSFTSFQANAKTPTAKDLIGMKCGVIANNTQMKYHTGGIHKCSEVVAGSSSNEIIIKDFLEAFDLPLTVNTDGTLSMNLSNTFKGVGNFIGYNAIEFKKRKFIISGYIPYLDNSGLEFYGECFSTQGGKVKSQAVQEGADIFKYDYTIKNGNDGFIIKFASNAYQYFGSFDFCFFDAESNAVQTNSNGTTSSYNVDLKLDWANEAFQIVNLFNSGIFYKNTVIEDAGWGEVTPVSTLAYIQDDKNLYIPVTEVGGTITDLNYYGPVDFYESIYSKWMISQTGYWEIEYDPTKYNHFLLSDLDTDAGISGTYKFGEPFHKKINNHWVSNGGQTKTYVHADLNLTDAKYHDANKYVYDTKSISISGDVEFTHHVNVDVQHWGASQENGFYLSAFVVPDETTPQKYVESYDLYLLEGEHTTATSADFAHDTHGHNKAIWLTDPSKNYNTKFDPDEVETVSALSTSAGVSAGEKIKVLVPASELPSKTASSSNKYTVFVRTNYTNGINPTFHALTPITKTPTSIETVFDGIADNVRVVTVAGGIKVEGADNALVEVYNAAGMQVYAGYDSEISIAAGLYIVKVGGTVAKVNVK